jgi:hypothetical protein
MDQDPYSIETLGYEPESDQMPPIFAWVTYDPEVCKQHIQGSFEQEVNCFPMPGFNDGPGGANPQPYLVWFVLDGTCDAAYHKECFPLSWWVGFTNEYPDPYNEGVQFFVMNHTSPSGVEGWPVDLTQQGWRILPDYPPIGDLCQNGSRVLEVKLVASTIFGYISNTSNSVVMPCPQPLGDTVDIEVNFYSLTFDNVDDGLNANGSSDEILDAINGWFGITPVGQPDAIRMGNMEELGQCFTPFNVWPSGVPFPCIDKRNGAFLLENEYLCAYEPYGDPNYSYGCMVESEYQPGKNKIVVTLRDQDALQIFVNLDEYDNMSDADPVCQTEGWVGPRTLDQWAGTFNEALWYYMGDNGNASCAVEVILNALKPGQ